MLRKIESNSIKGLMSIAMLVGLSLNVSACNIPVFRYALERWKSDSYEIVVLYDELSSDQEQFVAGLEAASTENSGLANAIVVRSEKDADQNETNIGLWKMISQSPEIKLPYLVVRGRAGQGREVQPWKGSFDEAKQVGLLDSPIRKELVRRLQNGHSIVWLMLRSSDPTRSAETRDLLKSQCQALESKIKLPDGIGLPGSELHSEIPLLIKFSFLEIDPDDRREELLVKFLMGIHPEAMKKGEPLIAPVFGRGRALEVIPASEMSPNLMEDLTLFLGGACSCQVKEKNPGFDLILSTDWNRELFGENGLLPPPAKTVADSDRAPILLTIPPGRKKP